MLGTHVIWDFGLQSSVTLVIPWISNTHYRAHARDGVFDYYTTGLISIWYQTNYVVPIGAPNTAYIIALAAAQKNFTMKLCKDTSHILQTASIQGDRVADVIESSIGNSVSRALTQALPAPTGCFNYSESY
uniref:Picornavirus capsid domain-containing protein n=1 Tax=Trichinella nativa TaxID=6335 RepID=A0A0V1KIK4_9BILA